MKIHIEVPHNTNKFILSIFDRVDSRYTVNLLASVSGCQEAQQTIMFLLLGPVFISIQRVSNSSCKAFK